MSETPINCNDLLQELNDETRQQVYVFETMNKQQVIDRYVIDGIPHYEYLHADYTSIIRQVGRQLPLEKQVIIIRDALYPAKEDHLAILDNYKPAEA